MSDKKHTTIRIHTAYHQLLLELCKAEGRNIKEQAQRSIRLACELRFGVPATEAMLERFSAESKPRA